MSSNKGKGKGKGKSKSKSPSPVGVNIAQHANSNALGALGGVNRSTRVISQAEYDRRIPQLSYFSKVISHTKKQLIDKIWYILTVIYTGGNVQDGWPEEAFEYLSSMNVIPTYEVDRRPYNALHKLNTKRGYLEFMKHLNKALVLGMYSWMNGKFFDYYRAKHAIDSNNENNQRTHLRVMTQELERPDALAIKYGL